MAGTIHNVGSIRNAEKCLDVVEATREDDRNSVSSTSALSGPAVNAIVHSMQYQLQTEWCRWPGFTLFRLALATLSTAESATTKMRRSILVKTLAKDVKLEVAFMLALAVFVYSNLRAFVIT